MQNRIHDGRLKLLPLIFHSEILSKDESQDMVSYQNKLAYRMHFAVNP